jgi:hypothetical protein
MTIAGVSLIVILGLVNLLLVLFQIATGKRWISVPFSWHRGGGVVLLVGALIHGVLAFLAR